ncbi:hypothetical protein HN51_006201 [Arachis hypogaea]
MIGDKLHRREENNPDHQLKPLNDRSVIKEVGMQRQPGASTNSELNLKAIFRPGRFRDAPNNQRMTSAFLCVDPISMGT